MSGWISLHRQIQNHWIWEEKPFDKRSAWIDLLLLANHDDNKFLLGNELVEVKRGQRITSEVKLAERWGWSRTKVRSFLELLENDNMIIKKSDNRKTVLTIVNYSDYQDLQTAKEQQKNSDETAKEQQKNTNNNDNNYNNDNKIYSRVVDYLNSKCNTKYKSTTAKTKTLIKTRLNEGFTEEQLLKVIDIKSTEWLNTDMAKYLRPETLFGTKFEGYLNQEVKGSEGKYGNRIKFDMPETKRNTGTEKDLDEEVRKLGLL